MEKGGTRREILDAALELFSVQGYGATSVSQIADAVGIRNTLQRGEVTVVICIGVVVVGAADHLQRVDDDQHRVGVLSEERAELFLQTLTKGIAVGGEVDAGGSVLRDLKQTVLDAESRVLQAEVERGTLLHAHTPNGIALCHRDRQPQRQP